VINSVDIMKLAALKHEVNNVLGLKKITHSLDTTEFFALSYIQARIAQLERLAKQDER